MKRAGLHQFRIHFDTIEDFRASFLSDQGEAGFFCDSTDDFNPGERVNIEIEIKGLKVKVDLQGIVMWRRIRSGGATLPAGVFVGLTPRDRARLTGVLRYFKESQRRERRETQRWPLPLDATYQTSKGVHSAVVRDVSEQGVFIICQGPLLALGTEFPLTIRDQDELIQLVGRVAWIDVFENTRGMGLLFDRKKSDLRKLKQVIKAWVKKIKEHTPGGT